ncbi:MAG: hypothetical protein ABW020_12560 [Candidatus Rokuibacteriota bacterium]
MRERTMLLLWVLLAAVFVVALLYAVGKWRSLSTEGQRAAAERERLTREIRLKEEEIVKEMRGSAGLLQEMQWTDAGGDPAAFLTRFADLVQQKRVRVTAIGPLERSATAQFSKSWHTVTMVAPYAEVKELATRIESEKGILEDMSVEPATKDPAAALARSLVVDETTARFKMTALELTPEARKVFDRSLAAAGPAPAPATPPGTPSLSVPVPVQVAEGPRGSRDPFGFAKAPAPVAPARGPSGRGPGGAAAATPQPPKPEVVFELRGIVGFPGGHLAILNNQIVKVGDQVSGHRVERITDTTVVLREREGGARTVPLPDLLGGPAAGPPSEARR